MPRGVGKDFVRLLRSDAVHATRRSWVWATIGLVLFVPAYFLWEPWGLAVHGGAFLVGMLIGLPVAVSVVGRFEDGLRGMWNKWMDIAPGCETVAELHRKTRGRSSRNQAIWLAAALTFVWAMELLLIVIAFQVDTDWMAAAPVLGINGLVAGLLLGYQLRMRSWTRSFRANLDEMVNDGEIGIWGVR